MRMKSFLIQLLGLIFMPLLGWSQAAAPIVQPSQPTEGPGGAAYLHEEVIFQDYADKPYGYWLFEPASPRPDSAHVLVFVHGYGGYNPMIYGKWIKHLVRRGNIVIFPRYQKDLFFPRPPRFAKNVARAIRDALDELQKEEHVKPITDQLLFAGHSYGGIISAKLAVQFDKFAIPQPKGLLLCAPGTGPLTGGRLRSYKAMPADTKIVIVVSENDEVVGEKMAKRIHRTAIHTPNRDLLYLSKDQHGDPAIKASHNQSYSLDLAFDSGKRNFTAKRALRLARFDVVDHHAYWKILDAMADCIRAGTNCDIAIGGTPAQLAMGTWSDGQAITPLKVYVPKPRKRKRKQKTALAN